MLSLVEQKGKLSYEARKVGIEKRFSEILASVRAQLEQLRAYVIKSNSELERRHKESKASLARKGTEKAALFNRLEDDHHRKVASRFQAFDSLVRVAELAFVEALAQMALNNSL
jgi:hypothetical protein